MANERTPLRSGPGGPGGSGPTDQGPTYVFMTNSGRLHRNKIRQFQCCVCAAVLGLFVMALIITIAYSVEHENEDKNVNTSTTTPAPPPAQNASLRLLLRSSWPIPDADTASWPAPDVDPAALQAALAVGKEALAARSRLEARTPPMSTGTPSYRANQAVKTRKEAVALAMRGTVEERATQHLLKASGRVLNWRSPAGRGPRLVDADPSCAEEELPLPCPATPYRSADGTCNNLRHPRTWGVAMRPFRRVLPAAYEDGVSTPRSAGLPSAREVSVTIHRPLYRDDPDFTVMLAVWGQFMDHDITATALSQRSNGSAIACCGAAELHPECFPVPLAAGDPYFHKYNLTCMEFVRSAPAPTCSLGPREQLNQATSYLDGSVVYGPTLSIMSSLREGQGGRLKMSSTPDGRELLPVSDDPDDGCNRDEMNKRGRYCFMSGDARANENLHLTTLHLLWARQHNRLSSRLQSMNPHWSGEKAFQESRRIVAAQIQHITYNEFLPIILGPRLMAHLDLAPKKSGYDTSYDPEIDPTICNSFAASSFRFAHTLLPGLLKLIGNDTSSPEFIELHQMLFDPYSLYSRDGADRALRGAMETRIERADNYFNPEDVPKRSIGHGSAGHPACGLDLVSLNVQRGRDHGLPPYPAWREHCGYPRPRTWEDLDGIVDEESLKNMKEIYKSVDDVDVYTGSLSEYPAEGGLLGETVTCMLTDQFVRLKRGDRFWYETNEQPQAFTPAQLAEIRKTSLAGVICSTSDGVHAAQPEVMRRAHAGNERVSCAKLPRPSLRAWVERDGRYVVREAGVLRATDTQPPRPDEVPDEEVLVKPKQHAASTSEEDDVESTARAVRVGGHVTGGSLTSSSGSSLWSGALPLTLPLPERPGGPVGVHWEGSLVSSGGTATLEGSFHLDAQGRDLQGQMSLQLRVDWETSKDGVIDVSGTFLSPVHLRSVNKSETELRTTFARNSTESSDLIAPVVLDGYYPDEKTFVWNGDFTLVLPTRSRSDGDEYIVDEVNSPDLVTSYSVDSKSNAEPQVVIAEVTGGGVAAKRKGKSEAIWWNGSLPVQLETKSLTHIDGVKWSAKLGAPFADFSSHLTGSFKLPLFTHGSSSQKGPAIEWWSGTFSADLRLLSHPSLEGFLPHDKQLITSRILFQSDSPSEESASGGDSVLSLVAAVQELVEEAEPVHIIFKGSFSPDRATFTWGGKIAMVIPARKPDAPELRLIHGSPKQAIKAKSSESGYREAVKIVAKVMSGRITSSREGDASDAPPVWSGSFPVPIQTQLFGKKSSPPLSEASDIQYAYGVLWNGTLSTVSPGLLVLEGTYSLPQQTRTNDTSGFQLEWWKGAFSFTLEPLWSSASYENAVNVHETYNSPIYFKNTNKDVNSLKDSPPNVFQEKSLSAFVADSAGSLLGSRRAPVILQGAMSPDHSTLYWNGNVFITLPYLPPSKTIKLSTLEVPHQGDARPAQQAVPSYRKIGVRVTSGSVYAYPQGAWFWRTWWTGNLPASIPVPAFDSRGSESLPFPTGPVYHACGVEWSGSITALSAREVRIKGKFSFPQYKHSPTGLAVTWYYGVFDFKAQLLWNASVEYLQVKEEKFSTHVYFRSEKLSNLQRPAAISSQLSLLQFAMDSQELMDTTKALPVVLNGVYNEDRSAFLWTGDAILSVPRAAEQNRQLLQSTATESKLHSSLTSPGSKGNSTKAKKPTKVQISGKVIGGFVNATFDNSTHTNIWSGAVPMWLPNPLFGVQSYTLPQTITWKGAVEVNDTDNIVDFSGTFTMPHYDPKNDTARHLWRGSFNVKIQMLWKLKYDVGGLGKTTVYSSRVVYVPPRMSGPGSRPVPAIVFAPEGDDKSAATILLQGTYSFWSSSWFWWTGGASISMPLDSSDAAGMTQSSATRFAVTSGKETQRPRRSVTFAVVEGSITTKVNDQSPQITLWSGSLPATIPSSLFNDEVPNSGSFKERSKFISWTAETLQSLPNGEFILKGNFRYPRSLSANASKANYSIEWWSGEFSLVARQIGNESLASFTPENKKFLSAVILKEMKNDESVLNPPMVVTESKVNRQFITESAAITGEVDRAPLFLQGSYSPDRSSFVWSGNAVLVLTSPTATSKRKKPVKGNMTSASSLKGTNVKKIGGVAITGSASAQKGSELASTTVWSGALPVRLPSEYDYGVFWSGSLTTTSTNTVVLSGNYSTPLPAASGGGVEWWRGDFTVTFQLLWNASVDGLVAPGATYFSKVLYRPRKWLEEATRPASGTQSTLQLAAMGEELLRGALRAPVFLDGFYTPENSSSFTWTGEMLLVLPTKRPAPSLRASPTGAEMRRASLGVKVSAGSLSSSIWDGLLPVAIPVAAVKQMRPFTWTASQVSFGPTGAVVVKGTFSAPIGGSVTGDFQFSGDLLWSNAPSSSIALNTNFTSAIFLQHTGTSTAQDGEPWPVWRQQEGTIAPIILQGRFSEDGKAFDWLGNAVIAIPIA